MNSGSKSLQFRFPIDAVRNKGRVPLKKNTVCDAKIDSVAVVAVFTFPQVCEKKYEKNILVF